MLNRRFVPLWIISFLGGIASAPVIALLAVYMESELHQPPLFAAGYRAVYTLLGGLFALPGGALCDSLGRKRTYLIGLTGVLALVSVFLVRDPYLLLLFFLYAGVTTGLQTTAGQTYMMGAVPKTAMGMAAAAYFLGGTLGNSVGNFAVGHIVEVSNFHTAGWWLFGLTALTIIIALVALPHLPLEGQGRTFSFMNTIRGYARIAARHDVLLLLGIRFIPTFYWGIATLLIPLLIYRATQSTSEAANYASVSLLIAAGFQLLTGRVLDRIGFRTPVLIAITLEPVAAILTAIFANSVIGLYAAGILGAAAAWSLSTTMPGLIRSIAGEVEQGRVLGITHLAWSMGMLTGSLVGGQLVDMNPSLPFMIAALLGVPAIFMAWQLVHVWLPVHAVAK